MKKVPIQRDLLRAIELAALVYEHPREYREMDLADKLGISVQTLRRDAQKLREMGIRIHSSRKHYEILEDIKLQDLNDLICIYLSVNKFDTIKNLKTIRKKFGKEKILGIFVRILKAIDEGKILYITYQKDPYGKEYRKQFTPLWLTRQGRHIYLVGLENDDSARIRNYLIERLNYIEFTNEKSKVRQVPDLYSHYSHAWGMYTTDKIIDVVLKFDKKSVYGLQNKIYMEDQIVKEEEDHYILKMKVGYSYEFASWVMGWGGQVEVLEPAELRDLIVKKAKEIIKKYKPA